MQYREGVVLESTSGEGRPLILVRERENYALLSRRIREALHLRARLLECVTENITSDNWESLTSSLRNLIQHEKIRAASYIGLGAGCTLVQSLALSNLKHTRTLTLIDGTVRPHPTRVSRVIDSLEAKLPLGLPLRVRGGGFDARPFLQRIRCPVLVALTTAADSFLEHQAQLLQEGLPSAWLVDLKREGSPETQDSVLCEKILAFQDVPAKCPQRRV